MSFPDILRDPALTSMLHNVEQQAVKADSHLFDARNALTSLRASQNHQFNRETTIELIEMMYANMVASRTALVQAVALLRAARAGSL